MQLYVKQGREYVLGGKVYKSGEAVDVLEKHAAILTTSKGPLQRAAAGNATDLPPAKVPDIVALRGDYESTVGKRPFMGWDAEELKTRMETYRRTNLTSADYNTTALRARG